MATTRRLGKQACEALGYVLTSDPRYDRVDICRPPPTSRLGVKPLEKGQLPPTVQADAQTVTITDKNYSVTFYVWFGKAGGLEFNGIKVKGWPDNEKVHKVLEAWNIQRLDQEYVKKINWLMENPGFKEPLVKKAPQKRVYASEVG